MKQRLRTAESCGDGDGDGRPDKSIESRDQNERALVLQGEKARGRRGHEIANSSSS